MLMNKSELISSIAKDSKLTKADTERVFNSLVSVVIKTLKKGDKITVPGFISFNKKRRAARSGLNPQTGKKMQIAAKNVVKIKAGKKLADAVK